jgi:hypothetical protein
MKVKLEFSVDETGKALLNHICGLIKEMFKTKIDISISKEAIISDLPDLDFIDGNSSKRHDFYITRKDKETGLTRAIGLTKSDFLTYCEKILIKHLEIDACKDQAELLKRSGVDMPSLQKAFDFSDNEFMSLVSDVVFPYVQAKWRQRFSSIRLTFANESEAIKTLAGPFATTKKESGPEDSPKIKADPIGDYSHLKSIGELAKAMNGSLKLRKHIRIKLGISAREYEDLLTGTTRKRNHDLIMKINELLGCHITESDLIPEIESVFKELMSEGRFTPESVLKVIDDKRIASADICEHYGVPKFGKWNYAVYSCVLNGGKNGIDAEAFADCEDFPTFLNKLRNLAVTQKNVSDFFGIPLSTSRNLLITKRTAFNKHLVDKIAGKLGKTYKTERIVHKWHQNTVVEKSNPDQIDEATKTKMLKLIRTTKMRGMASADEIVAFLKCNGIGFHVLSTFLSLPTNDYQLVTQATKEKIENYAKSV